MATGPTSAHALCSSPCPTQRMPLQAELHHVIYALSDALDLVGVDDLATASGWA